MAFLKQTGALLGLVVTLLFTSPAVQAKDPELCAAQANHVIQWTILRLQGIPKETLLDALDFSNVPKAIERDVRAAIDLIYKGKDPDPMEKAKEWFTKCLKSPEYGIEKEV